MRDRKEELGIQTGTKKLNQSTKRHHREKQEEQEEEQATQNARARILSTTDWKKWDPFLGNKSKEGQGKWPIKEWAWSVDGGPPSMKGNVVRLVSDPSWWHWKESGRKVDVRFWGPRRGNEEININKKKRKEHPQRGLLHSTQRVAGIRGESLGQRVMKGSSGGGGLGGGGKRDQWEQWN